MTKPIERKARALTEEKQTLRLILRRHDAKSAARNLGLSVHTINERLRDARRKMAVSSSCEAARLLFEMEGGDIHDARDESSADTSIGGDASRPEDDRDSAPVDGGNGRIAVPGWKE